MIRKSRGFSKVAFLVSSNIHKFNEIRCVLSRYEIALALLKKVGTIEIQDDNIENVAKARAVNAFEKCRLPVVVEDAGLFIDALRFFPGPYSSYVYRTIGNESILKLMENVANRSACFKSVAAFLNPTMKKPLCFVGEVKGEIVKEKRGTNGFGFDPIFKPLNSKRTFAEMTLKGKNKRSHRALAFREFAEWFTATF